MDGDIYNKTRFKKHIDLLDGGLRYLIEREKSRKMFEVFHSEKFVRTPELLSFDDERGLLIYEYIPNCRRVTAELSKAHFEKLGQILGIIHNKLNLPPALSLTRREDMGREGLVFIHGDFGLGNICFTDGKFVILDWGVRPWNREVYTKASGGEDLAAFVGSWILTPWWDLRLPADKLRSFMASYFEFVGVNSAISQLARNTLKRNLSEQYCYIFGDIGRRSFLKKKLLRVKSSWNIRRYESAG